MRRSPVEEARRQFRQDLLHSAAGVIVGVWLPLVIGGAALAHHRWLALGADLVLFCLGSASVMMVWNERRGWRRWQQVIRDVAIALPLWSLLNTNHEPNMWLWALKLPALLHLVKLSMLSTRSDALPPAAGRLLALIIILPLIAWWAATGWIALGGDAETTDAELRLVRAVYWAITTMASVGYGDIVPKTIPQMYYACAIMVTGVATFGYILSNIATLMLRIDAARQHQEEVRDRVEFFMQYHEVPAELRQRVRGYFQYLWASKRGYNDAEVFQSLPRPLRADLSMYLHRDLLSKVPLLAGASQDVLRDLVVTLRPVVYLPGNIICRKGAPGDEMYFVVSGEIEVLDEPEHVLARLHAGDFFGELALLTNQGRTATARAVSFCDLYVLDRESFARVTSSHPEFRDSLHQKVRSRHPFPGGVLEGRPPATGPTPET
jgi:voltage-gated potassium channel